MNNLCVSISSLTMQSCSGVMVTRVTPKAAQKSVKSGVERVVVILCVERYHQTPCTALQNGRVAEWPIGLTAGSRGSEGQEPKKIEIANDAVNYFHLYIPAL